MTFKPQGQFPLLEEYKRHFAVKDSTIFAYDNCIYADSPLSPDLIIHESTHLQRQNDIGLDKWVDAYIKDKAFRLQEELLAYKGQLLSIKDRNKRFTIRQRCVNDLCSDLYGNIVNKEQAQYLLS